MIKEFKGYKNYFYDPDTGKVFNSKLEEIGHKDKKNYVFVTIQKKTLKVHRLIAFEEFPEKDRKLQVHHINGDPSDNRICNLQFVTRAEHNKLHKTGFSYTMPEDAKHKISEALSGRKLSDTTKKKLSEKAKGRHPSDETKRKLSEVRKGSKRSDETKRKMSDARKKYWQNKKLNK